MDLDAISRLVRTVLYEGYLLYPYRPALKNFKRWTFGAVYPAGSRPVLDTGERDSTRARVLVRGDGEIALGGELRFLHLIERRDTPDGQSALVWHESEERSVRIAPYCLHLEAGNSRREAFAFEARNWHDTACTRSQQAVQGGVTLTAQRVAKGMYLATVEVTNDTPLVAASAELPADGDAGQALVSAHVLLHVQGGEFISRIDTPAEYREFCPSDTSDGLWPVLVGEPGERDTLLCSPIILYDYPEIATESAGDFFDATEIDEMLTLRIMTLTDEERQQMAALDPRGRALLHRTDSLNEQHLARLHGATRALRPLKGAHDGH